VVVFDHIVCNPVLAERGEKGARGPAKFVHNDYSFKSAPRRVRDHLPEEADRLLKNRFAEINVWRAIRGPIESSPLALCDARSLATEDIVPIDLVYRDRIGETLGFLYNPGHRWYYFPRMERNEAILLKCYDSKDDGRARFTAHTSFADPSSPQRGTARKYRSACAGFLGARNRVSGFASTYSLRHEQIRSVHNERKTRRQSGTCHRRQ
jgi:hypothetical protein